MVRLWVTAVLLLAVTAIPASAGTPYLADEQLAREAQSGFEQILDLWRDRRYEELWERTLDGSKTKEQFVERFSATKQRPACCWEKMQEVKVTALGQDEVKIRAKLGFEGIGTTTYKTKAFRLVKEEGVWRMTQNELLSLAGSGKGKKQGHKKKSTRHRTG